MCVCFGLLGTLKHVHLGTGLIFIGSVVEIEMMLSCITRHLRSISSYTFGPLAVWQGLWFIYFPHMLDLNLNRLLDV